MSDCCENSCFKRLKTYCLCAKTNPQTGGIEVSVVLCEEELKAIYMESGSRMSWREFSGMAQDEADKAAREALPTIATAQASFLAMGMEQMMVSIRFCIRIGGIRICVEWLL